MIWTEKFDHIENLGSLLHLCLNPLKVIFIENGIKSPSFVFFDRLRHFVFVMNF